MTEAVTGPDAGVSRTTQLLRVALETRIARTEEELALIDRQHQHLSTRIEECQEAVDRAENIKLLVVNNIEKYSSEEVLRTIEDNGEALSKLAFAERHHVRT